jgi:hypothetical protein
VKVVLPIPGEFEEKSFPMTAMRNVPDMTGQKVAVGAGHRFSP